MRPSLIFACALSVALGAAGLACQSSVSQNDDPTLGTDDSGGDADSGTKKSSSKKDSGKSTTKGDAGPKQCDPYAAGNPPKSLFIGPTAIQKLLVDQINAAEESIDIMIYELDAAAVVSALEAAASRGVKVRFVIDNSDNTVGENKKARDQLVAAGVEFTNAPAEFVYQHAKTMIIDGSTAVVMSSNLNGYSMSSERNYGVITTEPGEVADLQAIFDRDRAGGGDIDLSCSKLVVSPLNAKERLLDFINSAKTSLDMALMYMTDNDIEDAVNARAKAGVAVRVLLADPAWIKDNTATASLLTKESIPAKFLKTIELHAKLIVVDDMVFVGSENMSLNSLKSNREIGLFVSEADLVAKVKSQFEKDWSAGVTP